MDRRRKFRRYLFRWLILLTNLCLVSSQEDKCKPEFGYEKFMMVNEDVEVGSPILTLNTVGTSSEVNLTLQANAYFDFNDGSQNVTVRTPLDADQGDSLITLTISCQEPNKQPVDISVYVTIKDINDNPPEFVEDHFYVDVSETMTVDQLFDSQVEATDGDASFINSAIYYTVEEGLYSDYFQFPNALSPNLVLKKPLDFETLPNMTITVVATNQLSTNNQLNSSALLTIRVTDEDDLNPVFSSPLYEGSVLETAEMNTLVNTTPKIYAADEDITLNEPVYYSFHDAQSSQNAFSIDNITGQVRLIGSVGPSKVSVVVQATQRNNPSRYGVAMLVITVEGVNSNAPTFERNVYQAYASEAMPVGSVLLSVSATDQDFGASITYGLVQDNAMFAINSQNGEISLRTKLDYETAQTHSFDVRAFDGSMDSTTTVQVNVVDANDHAPVIPDQPLSFDIERNFTGVITNIQASDVDTGTVLSFRLLNHNSLFSVTHDTGHLRISAEPAELTTTEYLLVIIVSDNDNSTTAPHQATVLATVSFPSLTTTPLPTTPQAPTTPTIVDSSSSSSSEPTMTTPTTTTTTVASAAMSGLDEDILPIVLGALAAVLLIIVIVLVIFICRRRNQTTEQLDKAKKVHRSPDPRGLKFKNAGRPGSRLDPLHFHGNEEDMLDGPTSLQENPLNFKDGAGAFNPAFVFPEDRQENDNHMDEIHIETAVIPYQATDTFNNHNHSSLHNHLQPNSPTGEMYQRHDDSSDYGDTLPLPDRHSQNPSSLMYPDNNTTSSESLNTSHNSASKPMLMGNGVTSFGTTSFGKTISSDIGGGGGGDLDNGLSFQERMMNPDRSVAPHDQKSELTVYF